jgi:hypothetical protein
MLPEDSQELAKSKPHHVPEDPETPTRVPLKRDEKTSSVLHLRSH